MLSSILLMSTPILLASLGGLFTELSGVLNIALEGLMLTGAFSAILITGLTGSMILGTIAAVASSSALAYLFGFITLKFKANIFITGLAANLFAMGSINYLSEVIFKTKGVIRFSDFPELLNIAGNNVFIFIAIFSTVLVLWIVYKTIFGLRVRASGYNSEVLKIKGVNPYPIQMKSILLSGVFSGIGGAALSLNLGAYVPNMTAGRGWIALVAIYLGRKHPIGIFLTCLIFASADYFSNTAQGILQIPSDLLLGFPYLITLVGMILFSSLTNRSKY